MFEILDVWGVRDKRSQGWHKDFMYQWLKDRVILQRILHHTLSFKKVESYVCECIYMCLYLRNYVV